jgi:large subunit ribosomal protein L18Ae
MPGYHEYQIIGRERPSEKEQNPKLFRMKIFAPSKIHAKSRFWYFMRKLKKIKTSHGEILSISEIFEKRPTKVKTYGILCRYNSRTGTHNVYKEFRDLSRVGAIDQLYMDMAARHRARYRSIQIIEVRSLKKDEVQRPAIKQFLDSKVKFPLVHRRIRVPMKRYKKRFSPFRPQSFFG